MALGGQVVDLSGLHLLDNLHDAHGVAQVGIMEVETFVPLKVCDSFTVVY